MTRVGWLDAGSGASGDMLLAALAGAGADVQAMAAAARAVVPVDLHIETGTVGGLAVHRAVVRPGEASPPWRTWADVRGLIEAAAARGVLDEAVSRTALAAFALLADAEASVHATDPAEVHFHEVGAHDSVADVVGTCAGFASLGLDSLHCSTVALGGGSVTGAHGSMPVPVPAVLEICRRTGLPGAGGLETDGELCTPTGAALLATLVQEWAPMPAMRVAAVGVGAGMRQRPGRLNAVRLVVGETVDRLADDERVDGGPQVVLETNVDDLDPRLWPGVLASLLDAGASDAWLTPILMKKGRPAHTLHVLAARNQLERLRAIVFAQTTAIGLREVAVRKHALDRDQIVVDVDGQAVRVKVARDGENVVNVQPEFDDVMAAATALGRPGKAVLAAAAAAARNQLA